MRQNRGKYLISYTVLFALILAVISCWLLAEGRSLVLGGDPVAQHVRALIYYARWLRELPGYVLREHALPAYSFSMGYGSDVITTLHFYVIGDPLNLFCALIPTKYMSVFYSVMIVVRMYLAGLSFTFMCFTLRSLAAETARPAAAREKGAKGKKTKAAAPEQSALHGILAGTLTYVFCAFTIFGGWRHPFFLNPMIYLPLTVAGAEMIRVRKRHLLFTLAVAISALSNFYFFYMIAAVTVVYALWKCACVYGKDFRKSLAYILHLAAAALTGVLLSGIILVPVLYAFAGNPRSVDGYIFDALFSADYYLRLPGSLITFWSAGEWGYIGISSAALLAILALFVTGAEKGLQVLFGLGIAALCVPAAGYVLNGFSYVSERWVWAFICLCAYMVSRGWEQLLRIGVSAAGPGRKALRRWMAAGGTVLVVLLMLSLNRRQEPGWLNLCIQLVLMAAGMGLFFLSRSRKGALLFSCMVLGICCNGIFGIVPALGGVGNGYYQWNRVAGDSAEIFDTEAAVIRKIREAKGESDMQRYSGTKLSGNASVQDGVLSTQFYWSLANGSVSRFFEKLGLCTSYANAYANLDDRTILNEIACVKYFSTQEEEHVPFGYTLLDQTQNPAADRYPVCQNRLTLPFGITYEQSISEEAFDRLDPGARGEVMLRCAVADKGDDAGKTADGDAAGMEAAAGDGAADLSTLESSLIRLVPEIRVEAAGDKAVVSGNTITALEDGARVRIRFEGSENSESFLYLGNIDFRDSEGTLRHIPERLNLKLSAYAGKKKVMTRTVSWFTRREKWYAGRNSFMIPAGFHEKKLTTMVLTLPARGTYSFGEMAVYLQPLDDRYEELAGRLKEEAAENVQLHTGPEALTWATGRIDLDAEVSSDRILCLQMAFSKGWKAWVDGEKVPLVRTNLMFTGVPLTKGDHHVTLRYTMPGLRPGTCMSLLGLAVVAWYVLHSRSRKRERRKH